MLGRYISHYFKLNIRQKTTAQLVYSINPRTMNISRNTIIIACTVAFANLLVIVAVLIVASRDPPSIFKRCDGLSDPIDEIQISSCPNCNEVGYCEFNGHGNLTLKLSFTPGKSGRCTFNDRLFRAKRHPITNN